MAFGITRCKNNFINKYKIKQDISMYIYLHFVNIYNFIIILNLLDVIVMIRVIKVYYSLK